MVRIQASQSIQKRSSSSKLVILFVVKMQKPLLFKDLGTLFLLFDVLSSQRVSSLSRETLRGLLPKSYQSRTKKIIKLISQIMTGQANTNISSNNDAIGLYKRNVLQILRFTQPGLTNTSYDIDSYRNMFR